MVVQKNNYNELEDFPRLAANLGFERLTLSLDFNDFGRKEWKERNDAIDMHRQFTVERAKDILQRGRNLGVEVTCWFIDEKYDRANSKKLCPWPFKRAYISSDMRVVPCCMISNPEVMDLGDAMQIEKEWNNQLYQDFREKHLTGDIPSICRTCYID